MDELHNELTIPIKIKILGNYKISRKSLKLFELMDKYSVNHPKDKF